MRQDRHEAQDGHHAPAAALGTRQQCRSAPPARPLGEAPAEIARQQKPGDCTQQTAERRPQRAPPHAEDKPGAERQQGARHEHQAGDDVQSEKDERRDRAAVDQLGQCDRVEHAAPMPRRDDADAEQERRHPSA